MFDVVTFGSAVVDIFVDTDIKEKGKYMCYPVGSKILLKNLKFDIGGGGTNAAVAFSRLGLRTGYIGMVGEDSQGEEILDCLKREKIRFLGKINVHSVSGYSIVLDSQENNRTILTYKGINDEIGIRDFKGFNTSWLYYSSLMRKSFATQKLLAKKLVKKGTKLAMNPSMYQVRTANLKPLLKIAEVLILNKEEAEMLLKKNKVKGKDLLEGLQSLGPRIVVVTDQKKHIRCRAGDKKYSLKPHDVRVVERTGAGDAFASGFVAGLIAGKPIEYCLSLGLRESESVIRHFGAKNKLLKMKIK